MNEASRTTTRGIYLREDAMTRVLAPLPMHTLRLNKRQQAAFIGMPYANFWRIVANGRRVTDLNIADVLHAADRIAAEWGGPRLTFDDLFEVRRADPVDAVAA